MGCQLCAMVGDRDSDTGHRIHRFFQKHGKHTDSLEKNTKVEISLRSAILIQGWYRRYLARMEVKQRYTWKILQSIEYAGELDQMKLYNFFNALLNHLESENAKKESGKEFPNFTYRYNSTSADLFKLTDPSTFRVDSAYKGPRLNSQLGRADLLTLIEGFKSKKALHIRYVYQILHEAIKVLSQMPTLNRSSTAVSGQVTVCGDLHGKLDDLLIIFHKNGLPSSDNPYIFNGDFVDRGKKSIEVLLVLLLCIITNPHEVYLNRGNHEDPMMNARYGFTREVAGKYKSHASKLLPLIGQLFAWLPIGTVVDNKVLVVHGGISSDTDIQWLQQIERYKYISVLQTPERSTSEDTNEALRQHFEWKQLLDIMWSDPKNIPGCRNNEFRGGGCYFGPDVTEKVLRRNGLQLLIRSHECKSDGYEFTHGGLCLTIFSASNYYGPGSNRGAYVVLQGPKLQPHFVQFIAQTKIQYINMRERIGALEASAVNELRTKIVLHKTSLMNEFRKADTTGSKQINIKDWIHIMEHYCCQNVPWRMLREKIVRIDSTTAQIPYEEIFQLSVSHNSEDNTSVVETLYSNRDRLETIFRILDKDNSGFLSLDEFADACSLLRNYLSEPIPYDEMVNMARSMDINKDGYIDFNEFLETFRLVRQA